MNLNEKESTKRVNYNLKRAEDQCKGNGARLTTKRKQVLSILLKLNKAVSAYDIINSYEQTFGETLPAMSIYRILEFLETEHLVHKLRLANKFVACSHIECSDSHVVSLFFICSYCDKVKEVEINPATFSELRRSSMEAGFDINTPQLELNCICTECSE